MTWNPQPSVRWNLRACQLVLLFSVVKSLQLQAQTLQVNYQFTPSKSQCSLGSTIFPRSTWNPSYHSMISMDLPRLSVAKKRWSSTCVRGRQRWAPPTWRATRAWGRRRACGIGALARAQAGGGCVGGSWEPLTPWKIDEHGWVYPEKMDEHGWILRSAFLLEFFFGWHFFTVFWWIWTTPKLELDTGHFTETRDFTYAGELRSEMGKKIGSLWQRDYVVGHPPRIGSRNCKKPPSVGITG